MKKNTERTLDTEQNALHLGQRIRENRTGRCGTVSHVGKDSFIWTMDHTDALGPHGAHREDKSDCDEFEVIANVK